MITAPRYQLTIELIVCGRGTYADNTALHNATVAETCADEARYAFDSFATKSLAIRAFSAARLVLEPSERDQPLPQSPIVTSWLDRFHQANAQQKG